MSLKKREFCEKLYSYNSLDTNGIVKEEKCIEKSMSGDFVGMKFGGLELIKE